MLIFFGKRFTKHEHERLDDILEGLLLSQQPDKMKEAFISRICTQNSQHLHPEATVRGVLQISKKWILRGTTNFQVSSGFKLFNTWGSHNPIVFQSFFTPGLVSDVLRQDGEMATNVPLFIREGFRVMSHVGMRMHYEHAQMVQRNITKFVCSTQKRTVVHNVVLLLEEFTECIPLDERDGISFCLAVLNHLSDGVLPQQDIEVHQFIQQTDYIAKSLGTIWKMLPLKLLAHCLLEIFNIISTPRTEEQSDSAICLAAVARHIPMEIANKVVKNIVTDPSISDRSIATAVGQILEWLKWPTAQNVEFWLMCFLTELGGAQKYSLLDYITEAHVEQVLENTAYPYLRQASFKILSHMLLGYQHSPGPFHKCLEKMSVIIRRLRDEETPEAVKFLNQMSHFIICLMHQHTGFPELYGPVLELLKDSPKPDVDQIKTILNQTNWSSQTNFCAVIEADVPSLSITSVRQEKLELGKTGLENLGNTCYMNSVLQALYMCDQFRRGVLEKTPQGKEILLLKLQYVFAYLSQSNRPAISPRKFLQASRPSWFFPGHQQDCSEFLKHLLNQLHEDERTSCHPGPEKRASSDAASSAEAIIAHTDMLSKAKKKKASVTLTSEKKKTEEELNGLKLSESCSSDNSSVKSLVERTFRGKVQTMLRCLACNHESLTVENFADIPLAFPNSSVSSVHPHKSLAGGGGISGSDAKVESLQFAETELASSSVECLSLNDLISFYLKPEKLTGDNKYYCDKCKKLQDGEKIINIIESPQYLIFTLMRFSYDTKLQARTKIFQDVCYPRTLSVPVCGIPISKDTPLCLSKQHSRKNKSTSHSSCALTADSQSAKLENISKNLAAKCENYKHGCQSSLLYSLSVVIIHSGLSSESGHYYCYARHSQSDQLNAGLLDSLNDNLENLDILPDKWYNFNDSRVSSATFESISNVTKRFSKDTPYVLIYQKLDFGSHTCDLENDLILHLDLREAVDKDNEAYFKEQEMATSALQEQEVVVSTEEKHRSRRRSSFVSSDNFYTWHGRPDNDDESTEGGHHCCWEELEHGVDIEGTRYVF